LFELINGTLIGIGDVYLATGSVTITLLAGVVATVSASLVLIVQRTSRQSVQAEKS